MKSLILVPLVLSALPALACFDREMKPFPITGVQDLAKSNVSFKACIDKLSAAGVDLSDIKAFRKDRAAGDDGPVIYTIMVDGADQSGRETRLYINYDLSKSRFTCGAPTHAIPKCF